MIWYDVIGYVRQRLAVEPGGARSRRGSCSVVFLGTVSSNSIRCVKVQYVRFVPYFVVSCRLFRFLSLPVAFRRLSPLSHNFRRLKNIWVAFSSQVSGRDILSCQLLPFQPLLWSRHFPSEPARAAKHSPQSVSEGGTIWQVLVKVAVFYPVSQSCDDVHFPSEPVEGGRTWLPPKAMDCFPEGAPRDIRMEGPADVDPDDVMGACSSLGAKAPNICMYVCIIYTYIYIYIR